jgi:hypothetical protein
MKHSIVLCVALALGGSLSGCTSIPPGFAANHSWGSGTDGLQMSLSVLKTENRDEPEFEVAFRNMGEHDVSLNLGYMLANGQVQLPAKIHLWLVDDGRGVRELDFSDKKHGGVVGRVDDYVVPLRSGSNYTLELRLEQFWSPATKEFELKLKPGRYEVSAEFQGEGAGYLNSNTGGMQWMNFWKGKLRSNIVITQ